MAILRVRDQNGNVHDVKAIQSGVPSTRRVNGKELSADIVLTAADVGAAPIERYENDEGTRVYPVHTQRVAVAALPTATAADPNPSITVQTAAADSRAVIDFDVIATSSSGMRYKLPITWANGTVGYRAYVSGDGDVVIQRTGTEAVPATYTGVVVVKYIVEEEGETKE